MYDEDSDGISTFAASLGQFSTIKKPSEDFVILLQTFSANAAPQDLPAGDNTVDTGIMTACISVIIFWNPIGGTYANVRGCHGGGGLLYVNWPAMRNAVTNANTTEIAIISGPDNMSDFERRTINTYIREEIRPYLPLVHVRTHHQISRCIANRQGQLTFPS